MNKHWSALICGKSSVISSSVVIAGTVAVSIMQMLSGRFLPLSNWILFFQRKKNSGFHRFQTPHAKDTF